MKHVALYRRPLGKVQILRGKFWQDYKEFYSQGEAEEIISECKRLFGCECRIV